MFVTLLLLCSRPGALPLNLRVALSDRTMMALASPRPNQLLALVALAVLAAPCAAADSDLAVLASNEAAALLPTRLRQATSACPSYSCSSAAAWAKQAVLGLSIPLLEMTDPGPSFREK